MGADDDHQKVQSEFDGLAVFRVQERESGEDTEKLVTGLLVLQDKADKIDIYQRNDEPGQVVKLKRADHDDDKGFFDSQKGENNDKQRIEKTIFFAHLRGRGNGSRGGHGRRSGKWS